MTICKLALANLAMWTRDQCFPASYAHATWARLVQAIINAHRVSVRVFGQCKSS